MSNTLIAIVLSALMAPAAAQYPADTAHPHPAPKAHANALAGQADAVRIEACGMAANQFLDQLTKGDFKAATENFDAKLLAALPTDKLGGFWQSVDTQFGKLESRGTAQTLMYEDMPVVTMQLRFEKGVLVAQLACDTGGKFAGFHLRPLPSAAPASAASSP